MKLSGVVLNVDQVAFFETEKTSDVLLTFSNTAGNIHAALHLTPTETLELSRKLKRLAYGLMYGGSVNDLQP